MAKKKPPKRETASTHPKRGEAKKSNSPGGETPGGTKPTTKKNASPETPTATLPNNADFPIVGVGASAGGLDALKRLLDATPEQPGFAFVVIQHLDPTRPSLTPELLAKHTSMQVAQATEDVPIEANHVYVIPPNKNLSVWRGVLRLSEPDQPRGVRLPIDFFMRSLAEDQRQLAVGVILSGTGADGTLGVKAIKAAGGLVLVQDPDTSEYAGMPESAIASGVVDHVLPVAEIPAVLLRYARSPYLRESLEEPSPPEPRPIGKESPRDDDEVNLNNIFALLRARTRRDFRCYKSKTIIRRIRRRMCLLHIDELADYLDYLRLHDKEVDALVKDLLISVTDFFRDPDAWRELKEQVVAPVVAEKNGEEPIRVWVPGCATGEEPYSVAMLILEELYGAKKGCPLQVFATDIDMDALEFGRAGRYPVSITADVSPELLKRFFTTTDADLHHYQVNKRLRETVTFAEQNLVTDPPFSKLDLICCRNLLIYLKPEIQEKIIALFHFGLCEGGYLFLGNSETVGRRGDLFQTLSKRWRIYRRLTGIPRERVEIPIPPPAPRREVQAPAARPRADRDLHVEHLVLRRLVELVSPSAVVIDTNWKILYISGDVNPYLVFRAGVISANLLDNARRGLRTKLRGAVYKALEEDHPVRIDARVERDGKYHSVWLSAQPLQDREYNQKLVLIAFESAAAPSIPGGAGQANGGSPPRRPGGEEQFELEGESVIRQLEDELATTKQDLQSTIEQLETSNEEYKAANEEVMSMNEELQSTNEELETSKEELQSLNEELTTVNNQLGLKVEELQQQRNDMENLLVSTDVATICLDRELKLRWFTPAAQRLVRLTSSDRGRPISHLTHDFVESDLVRVAEEVRNTLATSESEVHCIDGRVYIRHITPYRTDEDRISGVVITYMDVTKLARTQSQFELLAMAVANLGEGVLITDDDLDWPGPKIVFVNEAMCRITGYAADELIGQSPRMLQGDGTDRQIRERMKAQLSASRSCLVEVVNYRKDGTPYDAELFITPLFNAEGRRTNFVSVHRDISERKQAESLLRQERNRAQQYLDVAGVMMVALDAEGCIRLINRKGCEVLGYHEDELIGRNWFDVCLPHRVRDDIRTVFRQIMSGTMAAVEYFQNPVLTKTGEERIIEWHNAELRDEIGRILGVLGSGTDITERLEAEQALQEREARLRAVLDTAADAIITIDRAGTIDSVNPATERLFGYSQDELVGQNVKLLMPSPYCDEHDGYLARFMETSEARIIGIGREVVGRRKDGSTFPVDLAVSEIGHLGMFTGIVRDISDRRELQRQVLEIAAEEDRWIGHELHEGIQQELTAMELVAGTLRDALDAAEQRELEGQVARILAERDFARSREIADKLCKGLAGTHAHVQQLSRGIMPVQVDAQGLNSALAELAASSNSPENIHCRFDSPEVIEVGDNTTATHLYRIAQEAVNNALRHSQGTEIRISLARHEGQLILEVSDNGVGIDEAFSSRAGAPRGSTGIGLRAMHYRAGLIGATLDVRRRKGGGTQVTCSVLRGARSL